MRPYSVRASAPKCYNSKMKKRILLFVILVFPASTLTFSQTKTITNADLESFRSERLKAEKDLRENYSKLGFPSPQELEKQIEESRVERDELAARLREEKESQLRYENERLRSQNFYLGAPNPTYLRRTRNYFYGFLPYTYFIPRFRQKNVQSNNFLPPIRPPKPIRPPRERL